MDTESCPPQQQTQPSEQTEQTPIVEQNIKRSVIKNGAFDLLDGSTLKGYPKPASQRYEQISSNELELDKTGKYLILGKQHKSKGKPKWTPISQEEYLRRGRRAKKEKRHKPRPVDPQAPREQYFYKHAFFFMQHHQEILSDSRLFLTPVYTSSGLMYFGPGGFRNATLGVYIEWWLTCDSAVIVDKETNVLQGLICTMQGSPLSGVNRSTAVMRDGTFEYPNIHFFFKAWYPFVKINGRYADAKRQFAHYSMEEAVRILSAKNRVSRFFLSSFYSVRYCIFRNLSVTLRRLCIRIAQNRTAKE